MSAAWTRYHFASTAARDAWPNYVPDDVGQWVTVGSPFTYYLITDVTAGVATFSQMGGSPVTYGSPIALTVGGANTDGVATTVTRSDHKHALPAFGSSAGTFCEGSDSRLSDSRAPNGSAGGDLSGTYPNPSVAALHETSGPTKLTIGTVSDGEFLKRSGSTIVSSGVVGGVSSVFSRSGAVTAAAGDYLASQVNNDSGVSGTHTSDALNTLNTGKVATSRLVNTTSPITGGGDLSADRTIAFDSSAAIPLINPPRILASNFSVPTNQSIVMTGSISVGVNNLKVAAGANVSCLTSPDLRSGSYRLDPRKWSPYGTPGQSNSLNDLFDSGYSQINSKWRVFDPSNKTTAVIHTATNCLKLTVGNGGGGVDTLGGVMQGIPNTEFAAYCAVSLVGAGNSSNSLAAGMFVGGDLVGTPSGAFETLGVYYSTTGSPWRVGQAAWTNNTSTTGPGASGNTILLPGVSFLRVRCNGTTWTADMSHDGRHWDQTANSVTLGSTPMYVGLWANSEVNTVSAVAYFSAFQVWSGAGTSAVDATYMGGLL